MSGINGIRDNRPDGQPNPFLLNLPNGQTTSNWHGNRGGVSQDNRGGRGFGNQRRPRGRGAFRGRRGRGGRFRGERRRLWDSRRGSDRDTAKTVLVPQADIRNSLDLFYQIQRTKEFPPLLKAGNEISAAVEAEIREFLRNKVPHTDHARHLTQEDFREMRLSEAAIAHLSVASSAETPLNDMVAARRLAGTLGLQLGQWDIYFSYLAQLHQQGICATGVVVPSVESDAAVAAIDVMLVYLDDIHLASVQIADRCGSRLTEIQRTKRFGLTGKTEGISSKQPSGAWTVGLACAGAALGLSVWYMAKFRA